MIRRIIRLLLFAFGAVSIFWFFFSFIGVMIGALLFAFSRDPRWRAHGFVLSLSAATSEFVSHTATALEPLHLGMRTGPPMLAGYLLLFFLVTLLVRRVTGGPGHGSSGGKEIRERRFSALITTGWQKLLSIGSSIWRRARVPLTVIMILLPVFLWASVSIRPGVLFDNRPRMLWVHAPSTAAPGEEFGITVQAWDAYERLSAVYRGTVSFSVDSYDPEGSITEATPTEEAAPAYLPAAYTFTGRRIGSDMAYRIRNDRDNGSRRFSARIEKPGIHYLVVHDSFTGNSYYSNPIWIREPDGGKGLDASGINPNGADLSRDGESSGNERSGTHPIRKGSIYWGDIHSHSDLSDGSGSAPHSYFFARYVACLDFYALTDHGEILSLSFGAFDKLERATNEAYAPGSFVTFHGVEWTQVKTGHYTCIFSGNRLIKKPRLSYLTVPTTDGLWAVLDEFTADENCRALALPHHTTQNSYIQDWSYINPKYVRLAEVTSVHGEFLFEQRHPLNYRGAIDPPPEYVHGSSIADALRMGKRLILYAAGDEHDGHPGHSLSHTAAYVGHQRPMTRWRTRNGLPYPGGLTAVYARELTREAVFSALEQGRLFAVSDHGRPLLSFTLNGIPVGAQVDMPAGIPVGSRTGLPAGIPAVAAEQEGGVDFYGTVRVTEPESPRLIEIFLAQDGSPAATRRTSAAAEVMSASSADGASDRQPGWKPDWHADIEIVKNGELLTTIPVNRPVSRIKYVDCSPVSGAAYGRKECFRRNGRIYINHYSDNPVDPEALNTGGADFYLIRVVGHNGRSAYAGPIWVEVEQ